MGDPTSAGGRGSNRGDNSVLFVRPASRAGARLGSSGRSARRRPGRSPWSRAPRSPPIEPKSRRPRGGSRARSGRVVWERSRPLREAQDEVRLKTKGARTGWPSLLWMPGRWASRSRLCPESRGPRQCEGVALVSKPSIKGSDLNTATSRYKASADWTCRNHNSTRAGPTRPSTRRTQVSGSTGTELRCWPP